MTSVATPRANPSVIPKMTLDRALRDRASALHALEQISSLGGPAGVIAREVISRIRERK